MPCFYHRIFQRFLCLGCFFQRYLSFPLSIEFVRVGGPPLLPWWIEVQPSPPTSLACPLFLCTTYHVIYLFTCAIWCYGPLPTRLQDSWRQILSFLFVLLFFCWRSLLYTQYLEWYVTHNICWLNESGIQHLRVKSLSRVIWDSRAWWQRAGDPLCL